MEILVTLKQLGAKRDRFGAVPFPLENTPNTVGELIAGAVRTCVSAYRTHAVQAAHPLTSDQIRQMAEIGKIAFGGHYNPADADESEAVRTALEAYRDGLFRIFINDAEAGAADAPVYLHEHDTVMFLRLTFLAGRMW